MKKSTVIALFIPALLLSCKNKDINSQTAQTDEVKVIEQESKKEKDDKLIDLSKMSKTIVYSELFNIMMDQSSYTGKTLRMKGTLMKFTGSDGTSDSYACVVMDATSCCIQGIELKFDSDFILSQEFPPINSEITVEGKFSTFTLNGMDSYGLTEVKIL